MSAAIPAFDKTTQQTYIWLNDIKDELSWTDHQQAYQACRAVLHALRDRLTVEEVAHLGAQLPMLMRGVFYEGWRPSQSPSNERHESEFLDKIATRFEGPDDVDTKAMTRGVLRVLEKRVAGGEIDDVKHMLPEEIRQLWS
jgi:uncharacterized protein (DUF2267 family)